ncbi:hypothetical protein GGR56DRAFT_624657 [Xylariaceae sp. FL0804]|nr:hypothetical protein GGR56DRAFT_624657 [Xylariaceae sp. FL0804]
MSEPSGTPKSASTAKKPDDSPVADPPRSDKASSVSFTADKGKGKAVAVAPTRAPMERTRSVTFVDNGRGREPGSPATGGMGQSAARDVKGGKAKEVVDTSILRRPHNGGAKKPYCASRLRACSPPPVSFQPRVTFDNIPLGDSTDRNPTAFTLNFRHAGFPFKRRHRLFMVGVDDNFYSDHALQWLLDELIDDGDEIVCVRVIEIPVRPADKTYQDSARELMKSIVKKNEKGRAISIVLEYAAGKLHNTFQHLIRIYQPSMLIVGTKGRSMDGVQGFLVNRSSFSKYCLQYSPIPVVVVRPTEMRERKKAKRMEDPARQSYASMLAGQLHEADSGNSSVYELEPNLTADEEAHKVAVAVGLPAHYDPTIKPIEFDKYGNASRQRASTPTSSIPTKPTAAMMVAAAEKKQEPDDASDSEGEGEGWEVASGEEMLKKQKLHKMESNEGAALRMLGSRSGSPVDSDEDGRPDSSGGGSSKK